MKAKIAKEWFLKTKWGKVSMVSWGDRHRPGILFVHGYMDSAATFEPLVSLLPDTYYYVAFDIPGHGKSDHIETSQLVHQAFVVEIIKEIVSHLQWRRFVCVSHSMGFIIAILYHHLYPGRIKKMINMDNLLPLSQYYYINEVHAFWFKWYYEYYYDHYHIYNGATPRLFTREQLVDMTMRTRSLSREQAETVLSRSLVPVENGLYRLSTQPIMRRMVSLPAFKESLTQILQRNIPPTLNIHANHATNQMGDKEKEYVKQFFYESPKKRDLYVDAPHDLHITHASEIVPHIVEFLNRKGFRAKL